MADREQKIRIGKLVFLMLAGTASIILLVAGGYQLVQFTDTTAFCGRLCHQVMYPEYTTHQAAPHARVSCAACHVGPGANYFVRSKVSGLGLVFLTMTGNYERPISTPVSNLRPARETCEECHWPQKFSRDLVRVHSTFASDKDNTRRDTAMVLKIGGGEAGVARNIHWHIAARVWYIPADEARLNIDWVGVEDPEGTLTEYLSPNARRPVGANSPGKRLMDCMDCHNRATHIFRSPDELIDLRMAQGVIDPSLPYIKSEGLRALGTPASSLEQALARVRNIRDFYRVNHPDVYQNRKPTIERAIESLSEIARLTVFPEMNVNWLTYKDDIGHQKGPGCFRCHGKLAATTGPARGKAIEATCELCHYTVPVPKA